ncbi:hypothetical protein [Mycobacteroides abscessus]|uniref:hypothetical protein n=1 Tax=Mycobacteroides abscessus TaxID=36809 RepID=UPI002106B079|nr:hypothetical protein [Mycobacteroides abscessus]
MSHLTIAALLIQWTGSLCCALHLTPFGHRNPRIVQGTTWTLWAISGLVATAAVAAAAVALAAGNTSITPFINLFLAALMAYAAIALLGLDGFWAAISRLLISADALTAPRISTDGQNGHL